MKQFLVVTVTVLLLSCNNQKDQETNTHEVKSSQKEQPRPAANDECFRWVSKNQDTVDMHIVRTADNIHGDLRYMWYEKDKSMGKIHGVFKGDTLRADYRFQSEGMESFREVVFVRKAGKLVQANGEMAEKNGKMVFTGKLDFTNSIVLDKVECD